MKDNETRPPGKHPQTRKLKWLSMLSALALMLNAAALCLPAAASDIADLGVSSQDLMVSDEIPFTLPQLPGDIAPEDMADAVLDMSTVPSVITAEDIEREGHVKRLYEQEGDVYTVVFQNRDLSKTTYIFPFPVTDGLSGEITVAAAGTTTLATTSDNTLVLNNAALAQKLGNPDIAGGIMSYMETLAPRIMEDGSGYRNKIKNVLYVDNALYNAVSGSSSEDAISSISAGYPCIAHVNTYTFPRYVSIGGNYVGGHYITVLGYDSVSGMLLFADCSYLNNRYGIYLVKCSDLDSSDSIKAYVGVY